MFDRILRDVVTYKSFDVAVYIYDKPYEKCYNTILLSLQIEYSSAAKCQD